MPEILLINPNYRRELYDSKAISLHPPLGLAYLASYLNLKKIKTKILEANAYNLNEEETIKEIINSDARFIGIGAVTSTIDIVLKLCNKIKQKDKSKIIILGGVHPSFLPKDTLDKCSSIDYIIIGEGEKIIYNLVSAIKKKKPVKKIKGIAFIDKKKNFIQNPDEELIKNLDLLPFPARDLLPIKLYKPGIEFDQGFKGRKYAEIITSRGCPNKCVYCSSAYFWKRVRMRSVENIFQEIKQLKNQGVKYISFLDDTFTISETFIINLCKKIKRFNLKWDCYVRVNNLTDNMIKSMKEAGCIGMRIGFESGNNQILKNIKKNTTIKQARNSMKIMKKYDIKTFGFFMIGLPGETKKTIEDTINFAIELNPHFASFAITTPFPGTEMFETYLGKKWLEKDINWSALTLHSSEITRTEDLKPKEILTYYNKAKKRFYLRPKYFLNVLSYSIRHPKEILIYSLRLIKKFIPK